MMEKKNIKIAVIAFVSLMLIMNIYTNLQLLKVREELNRPVTVHTTCGGSNNNKYINKYNIGRVSYKPVLNENNVFVETFKINVFEKLKGSTIYFRYRVKADDKYVKDWQLVELTEINPLEYEVKIELNNDKQRLEYHLVQEIDNDIVNAGRKEYCSIEYNFGDANCYLYRVHNSKEATITLQQSHPSIDDYKIKEVSYLIKNNNSDKVYEIKGTNKDEYSFNYIGEIDNIEIVESIEIKVIYNDGLEKSYKAEAPAFYVPMPVFSRR